jgi:hypothetical protein
VVLDGLSRPILLLHGAAPPPARMPRAGEFPLICPKGPCVTVPLCQVSGRRGGQMHSHCSAVSVVGATNPNRGALSGPGARALQVL